MQFRNNFINLYAGLGDKKKKKKEPEKKDFVYYQKQGIKKASAEFDEKWGDWDLWDLVCNGNLFLFDQFEELDAFIVYDYLSYLKEKEKLNKLKESKIKTVTK